eukprot:13267919-Ditylum_brightwellii.AAC.1
MRIEWKEEFDGIFCNKPFCTKNDMQFQFTYQQYIPHHYPFVVTPEPHVHFVGAENNVEKNIKTFEKDGYEEELSDVIVKQIHDFYEEVYLYEAAWELDVTGVV